MIVIHHKTTGEIIATFPEAFWLHPKIKVGREKDFKSYTKFVLDGKQSFDFENPYHPANIHDYQMLLDVKGKPIGLQRVKDTKHPKKVPEFRFFK